MRNERRGVLREGGAGQGTFSPALSRTAQTSVGRCGGGFLYQKVDAADTVSVSTGKLKKLDTIVRIIDLGSHGYPIAG